MISHLPMFSLSGLRSASPSHAAIMRPSLRHPCRFARLAGASFGLYSHRLGVEALTIKARRFRNMGGSLTCFHRLQGLAVGLEGLVDPLDVGELGGRVVTVVGDQ